MVLSWKIATIEGDFQTLKIFNDMKKFLSLYKDSDFFNRYASLIPAIKLSGYFGQVVSALTELGVMYTSIFSSLVFFAPSFAPYGSVIGAIIGVVIIEAGLRVLLPYSARAVLYRRFSGLDLPITIIVWAACAVLLSAGTLMSYHGSRDVVDRIKPKPKLAGTAAADSAYLQAEQKVLNTWRVDSTEIAQRYGSLMEATKTQYAAMIGQASGQVQRIEAKERAGQRFTTAKNQARERVATLEAEQAGKLATLQTDKSKEVGAAANRKTQALASAAAALGKVKAQTETANSKTVAETDQRTNRYKGGLSWFTIICHLLLIVSIALDEIHKKGSGIEPKVVPTQYDFSDSVLGELFHALSCRWNQKVRSFIRGIEERTPPPPLPLSPNELYSMENLKQTVFNLTFEQLPDANKNIQIESRLPPNAKQTPAPPPPQSVPLVPLNGSGSGNGQARRNGHKAKIAPGILNGSSPNGNGNGKHP